MQYTLHHGDCLVILRDMPDNSIDSIVTDPPYGLSFMGKKWDSYVPSVEIWAECLRVLKPGGHLLAFAGTRTQHRMAVRIEDAGFEIRDMIALVYSTGFPKSMNMDRQQGLAFCGCTAVELRAMAGQSKPQAGGVWPLCGVCGKSVIPSGLGTALKPALEPITVARKPLIGTVAENVLEHGTGALNIDCCRVGYASDADKEQALAGDAFRSKGISDGWSRPWMQDQEKVNERNRAAKERAQAGRWPANLIHDESEEVLAGFPDSNGSGSARTLKRGKRDGDWGMADAPGELRDAGTGSAARFFYCAKASKADRGEGNIHPTVKPTDLMRYLCRLVTPPGGVVLDPFMGSGSTGKAAILGGFRFTGCEMSAEYVAIAEARIRKIQEALQGKK